MDYSNTYNYFYSKTSNVCKEIVIKKFKEAKKKRRPFLTMANAILKEIHNYRNNMDKKLLDVAEKAVSEFGKRFEYYEGNRQDVISWVLEEEVLNAFGQYGVGSYNSFIADLAVFEALKEAGRHFHNYYDYYQLIYGIDKYEYFYLKDFEGIDFRSSSEYKEMRLLKYPEEKELVQPEVQLASLDNVEKSVKPEVKSQDESNYRAILDSFSDDERYLIANCLYELIQNDVINETVQELKISAAVFMKLLKIVGAFSDISVFYKEAKRCTSYNKLSKGLGYYRGEGKLNIIDSTLEKIEILDIKIIEEELKRLKLRVLSEQRIRK
ncbi:hypothetical protein [Aestuariibaculum sediminum]|uniref:Uncharacterized protein n=1 Tax=Aestuariibaculum sediminum TaxID=2770637 RepID=A0A8J6Q7K6_9FLAO|nr:hypothetical protein [Aestuariibaculum sediminum]MBD0831815.1 hypothetical protein [Aestuariibaculum sediminum]